jgi:hypothetical protein
VDFDGSLRDVGYLLAAQVPEEGCALQGSDPFCFDRIPHNDPLAMT